MGGYSLALFTFLFFWFSFFLLQALADIKGFFGEKSEDYSLALLVHTGPLQAALRLGSFFLSLLLIDEV